MRIRMTEERERRLKRLLEETGENTKAGAIDVAIKHFLQDKKNKQAVADELSTEMLRSLSTPWITMERRTFVGSDPPFRVCNICDESTSEIHQHHVSYQPERVIWVCNSCHGKIHSKNGFRDDLKPELSREEAEKRGLLTR